MLRRFLKGRRLVSPNRYCSTKANIVSINRLNLNGFAFKIGRYNIRSTHILILMQTVFTALIGNASEAQIARLSQCWATPPERFLYAGKKDSCKEWSIEGESLFSYRYAENMAEACKQNAKFTGRRQLLSAQYFLKIFFNFNFALIAFDCSCYKSQ